MSSCSDLSVSNCSCRDSSADVACTRAFSAMCVCSSAVARSRWSISIVVRLIGVGPGAAPSAAPFAPIVSSIDADGCVETVVSRPSSYVGSRVGCAAASCCARVSGIAEDLSDVGRRVRYHRVVEGSSPSARLWKMALPGECPSR